MYPNYATIEDLQRLATQDELDAVNDLVDTAQERRLLTHAARCVRWATRSAHYEVDEAYWPTDPELKNAMTEATALHALALIGAGLLDDVLTGGISAEAEISSTSENGASISFNNDAQAGAVAQLRRGALTQEAMWVLRDVGLLNGFPDMWVW